MQKFYKYNGKTYVSYPFLSVQDNLKDELLITQLVTDEPFAAKHGEVKAAWENFVSGLKKLKSGGEYVYHPGLSVKVVRERFNKYMEMVKAYDKEVPLRSGDDSEVFYERFGKLEEIYNLYNNAMLVTDDAKKDSLQKKKNDREAAD